MADTLGLNLRAGFTREAIVTAQQWPATVAAAITQLLPIVDVQPNDGVTKQGYTTIESGGRGPIAYDVMSIKPTVQVPLVCTYEGLETLWACALGYMAKRISGTVMPELVTTGVYRHLYEIDPGLSTAWAWDATADGFLGGELSPGQRKVRRGTFAVDMTDTVWEWLSAMVSAVTLQCDLQGVTLIIDLVSHSLSDTSSINTLTTLRTVLPLVTPRVLPTQLVWRIAPFSTGTPLGLADVVKVNSWTLRLENQLEATPGLNTGTAPLEYERVRDYPVVTVTFVLPRHTANIWQTRWRANTVLMADAKWTSEVQITSGQPWRLHVYLPSCIVSNAQLQPAGAGLPSDTVQLLAIVPSAAPAGFPTTRFLGALAVELYTRASLHPLL